MLKPLPILIPLQVFLYLVVSRVYAAYQRILLIKHRFYRGSISVPNSQSMPLELFKKPSKELNSEKSI